MRAITAAEILSLWEQTCGYKPLRQALNWLECAAPERSIQEWGEQPVGTVCAALFRLRALVFGSSMPGVDRCPRCGERVEFTFEADGAYVAAKARIEVEGIEVKVPSAADLLASKSVAELIERCAPAPASISLGVLSQALADADPNAETVLDLACPICGHGWQALLDIAAYMSREIDNHARGLLAEVHQLAAVYGWDEADILAMTRVRRRTYLEMASA